MLHGYGLLLLRLLHLLLLLLMGLLCSSLGLCSSCLLVHLGCVCLGYSNCLRIARRMLLCLLLHRLILMDLLTNVRRKLNLPVHPLLQRGHLLRGHLLLVEAHSHPVLLVLEHLLLVLLVLQHGRSLCLMLLHKDWVYLLVH